MNYIQEIDNEIIKSIYNTPTKTNPDDYQHCGFYNCKFYGNRLERIKHVKNQHTINE